LLLYEIISSFCKFWSLEPLRQIIAAATAPSPFGNMVRTMTHERTYATSAQARSTPTGRIVTVQCRPPPGRRRRVTESCPPPKLPGRPAPSQPRTGARTQILPLSVTARGVARPSRQPEVADSESACGRAGEPPEHRGQVSTVGGESQCSRLAWNVTTVI
jgi:hypothetical protein